MGLLYKWIVGVYRVKGNPNYPQLHNVYQLLGGQLLLDLAEIIAFTGKS